MKKAYFHKYIKNELPQWECYKTLKFSKCLYDSWRTKTQGR